MTTTGFTIWFTGLSGAGKSTISEIIERELRAINRKVEVLDGDVVRTHLSKGLGFSKEDRDTNIRRIGWVCEVLSRNDVVAIAAAISPYRAIRDEIRERIPNFFEVFVDVPLEVLIQRDTKGLYKKALAGEITDFTGVDAPYEEPLEAELVLHTLEESPEQSLQIVLDTLVALGRIDDATRRAQDGLQHSGMTDLRIADDGTVRAGE